MRLQLLLLLHAIHPAIHCSNRLILSSNLSLNALQHCQNLLEFWSWRSCNRSCIRSCNRGCIRSCNRSCIRSCNRTCIRSWRRKGRNWRHLGRVGLRLRIDFSFSRSSILVIHRTVVTRFFVVGCILEVLEQVNSDRTLLIMHASLFSYQTDWCFKNTRLFLLFLNTCCFSFCCCLRFTLCLFLLKTSCFFLVCLTLCFFVCLTLCFFYFAPSFLLLLLLMQSSDFLEQLNCQVVCHLPVGMCCLFLRLRSQPCLLDVGFLD